MQLPIILAGVVGGAAALWLAGSAYGAKTLFNKVIPRQDSVKVDLDEMADMAQWEEYKKIIVPNREWFEAQKPERVHVTAKDGLKLKGWYLPCGEEAEKLVICFHGYTSSALSNASFARFLHSQGFDCLLVDNRAHGESEGDYIGFGILDRYDCISWVRYVNDRFGGSKKILLYGVSMGATTAVMAAGMEELPSAVKMVVADCAFTSPQEVFSHILKRDYKLPKFPVMNINNAICRKKAGYGFQDYSTLDAVRATKLPILFIHGKKDDFVPVWMSEKNYEACQSPKQLLLVEGAGHGASYYENREQYETAVKSFISQYFEEADHEGV